MTEQVKAPSINNHLGVISEIDSKSIEIVTVLEQFKLSLQKMIDISSFENEWIQLLGLVYDQIDNIKKKQVEFEWDIDNRLKEEWIYFSWEDKDGIENGVVLSQEDKVLIKSSTIKNHSRINVKISRIDEILERLIKLKSSSFNREEYEKAKKELNILIFWDNMFNSWFPQVSVSKRKEFLLNEHSNCRTKLSWLIYSNNLIESNWQKDNSKPQLLESIIDMLDDKFKIENVDLIMDYYKKNNDLIAYLQKLNLSQKQEEVKDTNLSQQIQSLMNEIATMITQKLPEIETLITEKISWKI